MGNKVLIIIIIIGVLIMGMMGAGFFVLWKKISASVPQVETVAQEESEPEEEKPEEIGIIYPLKTFVVNLADQDRERYLRVAINLELKDEVIAKDVEKRLPQIMDSILMILPTKKVQDIQSSTGKIALRDEILAKLNNIFKSDAIKNIYFTEFVVQ